MNRFLLIFCLLLSSKLQATVIEQCIQNTSSCIYTEIDPQKYRRPTVFVPVEAYSMLNVAEVNEQEVDFQPIYKESIQKDLQGRKNFTEIINVQAILAT